MLSIRWSRPRLFALTLAASFGPAALATLLPGAPGSASLVPAAKASAADGIWLRISPPPARSGHTALYDGARDRLIVFGGAKPGAGPASCFNDVWVLPLQGPLGWQQVIPAGTPPPPRYSHSMVYDSARDRLLIMGGYDKSSFRNDVWALSLTGPVTWTLLTPSGTPPSVRWGHSAIYDPVGDRMIVFGGQTNGGVNLNDAWALYLSGTPAWSPLGATGSPPSVRRGAAAVYDPVRARMLVLGGLGAAYQNDAWALSLSGSPAWTPLAPAGTAPAARAFHSASYDAGRDEIVVFGGNDGSFRNDAAVLSLTGGGAWSPFVPAGSPPAARNLHAAAYDPLRDRLVLFAGAGAAVYDDLWALDREASPEWLSLANTGQGPPAARRYHATILDASRHRMVIFGGQNGSGSRNDVWALPLADGQPWAPIVAGGTPPSARSAPSAIYDPPRDRMLVFGGADGGYPNDVWELAFSDPPTWNQVFPTGTPPIGRGAPTAIYDPVRDRMIVFGGFNAVAGSVLSDVWSLSLSGTPGWVELHPAGPGPSAREMHSAVYDPVRDRMVVYGGDDTDQTAWALEFTGSLRWTHLTPANPPPARSRQLAAYDSSRDRLLVFGGVPGGASPTYFNDLWAMPLDGGAWTQLAPAGDAQIRRADATAVYDAASDRFLMFGGLNYDNFVTTYLADTWGLASNGVLAVGPSLPRSLSLAVASSNPARSGASFAFTLPAAGVAKLRVYDVSGRVVQTLVDADLPAGEHTARWDGRTRAGQRAPAGVYFCELRTGSGKASRRLAVLD